MVLIQGVGIDLTGSCVQGDFPVIMQASQQLSHEVHCPASFSYISIECAGHLPTTMAAL